MLPFSLALYRNLKRSQLHFLYYYDGELITFVSTDSIHKVKLSWEDWVEFHYQIGEEIEPLVYEMPDDDWIYDNENDYN